MLRLPGDTSKHASWQQEPGLRMQLLQLGVALRTRWMHLPYGDQGLFVDRDVFRYVHTGLKA